ncbi:DUF4157 domain-containing protein [Tenacibaculum sp. 1_MG-2023]|uniref:eCIS core domain-containing protein n=1 Tax=Tenacibaculum sp. 1_MG-2023 TaxID=3062653 RepID=UPI0026E39B22|nr:DUF4157 domain-containing protein [Tenacibaculum sp. 1_MG-2023]MDO6675256.1 DUF4157 domain-containing protein [Tenacibaculum sp. 1_MG-2023]
MFSPKTQHTTKPISSKPNGGGSFIQPKLNVGKPGDKYEVEADRAADKIVAKGKETPNSFFAPTVQKKNEEEIQKQESNEQEVQQKPLVDSISPVVQLTSEKDLQKQEEVQQKEEEEVQKVEDENIQEVTEDNLQAKEDNTTSFSNELIQQKSEEEIQQKEEEEVQEKEEEEIQQLQMSGGDDSSSLENDLNSSKGGGSPLPSNTQNEMESGFGADFSGVRVHNDSNAVQMNQELGSQAFTNGNDIYFNEGKYNPESDSGKHLLAHELTHTVQQGASPAANNVQKSEGETDTVTLVAPTQAIDITNGLQLSDDWLAYIEQESRTRNFDVNVKIGTQFEGTIKIRKLGRPAEGQAQKFELSSSRRNNHLDVRGMSFLNPLRDAGVFPVLVLRNFGEEQNTTGFLSVRAGEEVVPNVLGIIQKINENLEAMSFLGLSPIEVAEGLENRFENGGLNFRANNLSANIDGYIEATGSLGITDSNLSFELNSTVDIAGLASGEFNVARGADGKLSGQASIGADIANVSASLNVEYDDGAVTIQGTGRMNSDKFSGEITLLVTDATRSRQMMHAALGVESMDQEAEASANQEQATVSKTKDNQVLAGWGEVQATITPWLEGTAKVGIDNEGHVTIVGEIVVPDEIELMEQRGKKVDIFQVEIRAGYGIPLVGQVFLFASIGMFANAGFGPLVLKNVGFTGTYSTDPSVLQEFNITGTLGINAFAVLGLEAEAGVGVTLIGHDVKAGVNVTAAAGLRAYAEATPTFEYKEEASPEGGKVGESRLKGHFEAAAQLFLQLSGALFYELDSPWWSPAPDGREEYPLGEVQYPIGDSLGIGADVDWLVGGEEPPELTMSPVEFDADKFTADVMADPPPRSMGDSESSPEGEWQGENANSNQTENPEITGEGEGLPPGRREEDLSNLSEEQKYMRALDELSQMENANPKPTIGVVEDKINTVKRRYGIRRIQTRNEEAESVAVYVEHGEENNGRHLLGIALMSEAEQRRMITESIEDLRARERGAVSEDNKIDESAAQDLLRIWKSEHDVIISARVVDGNDTWDYLLTIGERNQTEIGKPKVEIVESVDSGLQEGDGEIGKIVRFDAEGENHRIWIRVSGNDVDVMIASNPSVIATKLIDWRSRLDSLDDTKKRVARGFLDSAEYLYEQVKNEAITANRELSEATATPTPDSTSEAVEADDRVESTQDRMVSIFRNLFTIFGDTDNEDTMYVGFERDIVSKTHLSAHPMLLQESTAIFDSNKALRDENKSRGFSSWSGLVNKFKSDGPKTKQVIEHPISNSEAYGDYTKEQVKRAADRVLDSSIENTEKTNVINQKIAEIEGGEARNAYASIRDQVFDREREPVANQRLDSLFRGDEGEHNQYKILDSSVDYDGTSSGQLIVNYNYTVQIGNQPPEKREFTVTIQQSQLSTGGNITNHSIEGRNLALKEPGSRGRTVSASNVDGRTAIQDANTSNSSDRDNVLNSPNQENYQEVMDGMRDQFTGQVDDTTIKFNASHLIADWFQGSGYAQALNLMTTSEHYNKQIMFGAESQIEERLATAERRFRSIKGIEYITFDLSVDAEWMSISDNAVSDTISSQTQEISGETPEQRRERLQELHRVLSRDNDPKFCRGVKYRVVKIHLKDKDGGIIRSVNSTIFREIGQDVHLREILSKQ